MIKRRLWGLGAVLAGALACATLAMAGAGAGSRALISRLGRGAETPALGVDARGDQTLAWTEQRGTHSAQYFWVVAAARPAGKRWSAAMRISDVSQDPVEPAVAVDSSGAAVVAWIEVVRGPTGFESVVEARTRPSAKASWRRTIRVGSARGSLGGLQAGIDDHGEVTLVWNGYKRINSPVTSATGSSATGRWRRAQQVGQLGAGALPVQLAVNRRGDAVLAWARETGRTGKFPQQTIHYEERVRYRPADRPWGPSVTVGRLSQPDEPLGSTIWAPFPPEVALDDRGGVTVIFQPVTSSGPALLMAHRAPGARRWRHTQLRTINPSDPAIGADGAGALTLAFMGQHGRLMVTRSRDGFNWSRPESLPGAARPGTIWLSVGQHGNAVLTWFASHTRIFVSVRTRAEGRWTRPTLIGHGVFPQAALDRAGIAAVTWLRTRHRSGGWVTVLNAATYPTR